MSLVAYIMAPADVLEAISVILFMLSVMNVSVTPFTLLKLSKLLTFIVEREIPRDVFIKYRNENMKKNYIDEISQVDPNMAVALAQAPFMQIKAFVDQYNEHVARVTGQPLP